MSKIPLLGDKKKLLIIIGCLIIGVILILFGSDRSNKKDSVGLESKIADEIDYSEIIEMKIEDFLKTVEGIDSVKVFVTVDGGRELEYAGIGKNEGVASDYLIIDKGSEEEAAVIREIYPGIRGVAISCSGGNKAEVKNEITKLIGAALGISTNKIMVTGYR